MRPAPRIEPAPDDHAPQPEDVKASRAARSGVARSRRRLFVGLVILVVVLAGAAIGAWAVLSNPTSSPAGSATPATVPNRPPFFFRIGVVRADSTGRDALNAARDSSVVIAGRLSSFYDTVFMDPATWKEGVPDRAWLLFDSSVRARARQESASFTLGSQAASLKSLRVENTSLSVDVLADPRGNPQAAVATVEFKAEGLLVTGQLATITNTASFLFRIEGGEWVVFGYPSANTAIETQALTPSAGPSSSSGTSASPTSASTSP